MRIFSLAAIAIVACAHQSANPPEPAAAATAELGISFPMNMCTTSIQWLNKSVMAPPPKFQNQRQ